MVVPVPRKLSTMKEAEIDHLRVPAEDHPCVADQKGRPCAGD